MTTRLAYTRTQAAEACGVSPDTIRRAIATGALRAKRTSGQSKKAARDKDPNAKPTGRYLITAKDLQAWLDGLEAA